MARTSWGRAWRLLREVESNLEIGIMVFQAKESNQNRVRLKKGQQGLWNTSEKSPEVEGQFKSPVLGDTERPHMMHMPWQAAATPGIWKKDAKITTDDIVWERINTNLWCTAWVRRMVTALLEVCGLFKGATKNAVAEDKRTTRPYVNGNNQFSAGQSCTGW